MSGDPYNLRIGIRPEEQENPLLLPYISVFAVTYMHLSSSVYVGTSQPAGLWLTQKEVDDFRDRNYQTGVTRKNR